MEALVARGRMIAALAVVVAIALVVRLNGADVRTLTWDEAYHLRLAMLPGIRGMLDAILANPPSDPLYALLLRGWIGIAGTSDVVMRLPSILAGVATALATAWLGLELTRSRSVALAATLLVAIAPYAVEFGQEMTLYSFATLWVTLALAAGWRWRRTGRSFDAALAVAFSIVAVYSHYVAAPILALALLLSAGPWAGPMKVSSRGLALAGAAVIVAWLPWLLPMLGSWLGSPYARTSLPQPTTLTELAGSVSQYTSGTGALLEGLRPVQLLGGLAAAVLLVLAWLLGRRSDLRGLRVVLPLVAVILVVPWLASLITGRWLFVPHLLLPVLPAVAVAAVAGGILTRRTVEGDARKGRSPERLAATVALAALFVAQVAGLYVNAQHPPHGDDGVSDLAAVINAEGALGEPTFISPSELQVVADHYLRYRVIGLPTDVDLTRLYAPYDADAAFAASVERFDAFTHGAPRAWLIYRPERDSGGRLLAALAAKGALVSRATFEFASLYVIELR
ncbi:MAG: glycosyltransferase family 39 protein [Candidatus Limnocylindrales bacterium]